MALSDLIGRCIADVSDGQPWPILTLDDGSRIRFVGNYDAEVSVETYDPDEPLPETGRSGG